MAVAENRKTMYVLVYFLESYMAIKNSSIEQLDK